MYVDVMSGLRLSDLNEETTYLLTYLLIFGFPIAWKIGGSRTAGLPTQQAMLLLFRYHACDELDK